MFGVGVGHAFQSFAPFLPTKVAGCALWLRADKGITLATGVSAWADQSGSGDVNKTFTQATGSQQPTYNVVDALYNGMPTMSIVGASNQFLLSGTWAASITEPFTIIIVGNDNGSGATYEWYASTNDGNVGIGQIGGKYSITDGTTRISTNDALSSAPRILCGVFNLGSSVIYNSAKTGVTGTLASRTILSMMLGTDVSALGNLTGKLAEVIVYNRALAPYEIAQVETYCGARYAISVGA